MKVPEETQSKNNISLEAEEKRWYHSNEFWINIGLLMGAMVIGHFYAENKNDQTKYWENFGRGTFFVTFFGGFIQRTVADSNRRSLSHVAKTTRDLTKKINEISVSIQEIVKRESSESQKFRQEVLESVRLTAISISNKNSENAPENLSVAKEKWDAAVQKGVISDIIFSAKNYSDAVEGYANKIKNIEDLDIEFDIFNLSIDVISKVHAKFFPPDYEIAGKLRTVPVFITKMGRTSVGPEESRYSPPKPNEVPRLLADLATRWNEEASHLKKKSKNDCISALARFHGAFTAIHPFLDGNGRVARILLKRQIQEFFGRHINPNFESFLDQYYLALADSDKGDIRSLEQLISKIIDISPERSK